MPSKSCIYCKNSTLVSKCSPKHMLGGVVLIAQSKLKHFIYFCLYGVSMKYKVEIFLAFKKCNKRCRHFFLRFIKPKLFCRNLSWSSAGHDFRIFNLSVGSWLIPILIYCKLSFMGEAQCLTRWSIQTFTQIILSQKMHPRQKFKFLSQLFLSGCEILILSFKP